MFTTSSPDTYSVPGMHCSSPRRWRYDRARRHRPSSSAGTTSCAPRRAPRASSCCRHSEPGVRGPCGRPSEHVGALSGGPAASGLRPEQHGLRSCRTLGNTSLCEGLPRHGEGAGNRSGRRSQTLGNRPGFASRDSSRGRRSAHPEGRVGEAACPRGPHLEHHRRRGIGTARRLRAAR